MTTALAPARPEAAADRATLVALAARETRRFAINPIFLFAVAMTVLVLAPAPGQVTEIDDVNWTTAVFLGGFAMMATFWLTRSLGASEPVVGVTPTTLPVRTAALCMVAIVPFACGGLALALSVFHPDSTPIVVLRLFAPFAFFTCTNSTPHLTTWRGSPWFFLGWQLALCAIAVLVALLRGAEGRLRTRIIRALTIAGVAAVILLLLAGTGGFTHAVTT